MTKKAYSMSVVLALLAGCGGPVPDALYDHFDTDVDVCQVFEGTAHGTFTQPTDNLAFYRANDPLLAGHEVCDFYVTPSRLGCALCGTITVTTPHGFHATLADSTCPSISGTEYPGGPLYVVQGGAITGTLDYDSTSSRTIHLMYSMSGTGGGDFRSATATGTCTADAIGPPG